MVKLLLTFQQFINSAIHMYLKWNSKTITDFSDKNITNCYSQGYLFARTGKGEMYQTRSVRIDLKKFELSSENRRVLRKTEEIGMGAHPLPYTQYDWTIGKMGKDFYDTKFGDKTLAPYRGEAGGSVFSANKIKELMTEPEKSNFNSVFVYSTVILNGVKHSEESLANAQDDKTAQIGYAICCQNSELLHYCYPFYSLLTTPYLLPPNIGLGMMLKAIIWAKNNGKKYVYLGSFSRPSDTYKLQFAGLEWWDGNEWKTNREELKHQNIKT